MSEYNGGPIAFLEKSGSAVYFSKAPASAGTMEPSSDAGTATFIKKLQNVLDVAYWGEDNRFPQNIEQQMAYCGIGKYGLDRKMRKLWGNGIVPGRIKGFKDDNTELFEPLDRSKKADKVVYDFIENRRQFRFWLENLQDWCWYSNTFPEVILSKDGKSITSLTHQESCDSRFKQMDENGKVSKVFLSKLWGLSKNQYAIFDDKKAFRGLLQNPQGITEVDNKFVHALDCIDLYDPVNSLKKIADNKKGIKGLKSAILPGNYPSVNKTYYQVPVWDGARMAGWVQIASKVPSLILKLYERAWNIKYHIEVPETFFERKYGKKKWDGMDEAAQIKARRDLLKDMDDHLSGAEKADTSLVTFFEVSKYGDHPQEHSRIKITPIDNKTNVDKDIITSSLADQQILIAMGVNPTVSGAGKMGSGQQRSGGSDIREADLVETSILNLERNVFLEPLYLVRDYNGWDSDIVFRAMDTVLTTLDTGAGTKKTLS